MYQCQQQQRQDGCRCVVFQKCRDKAVRPDAYAKRVGVCQKQKHIFAEATFRGEAKNDEVQKKKEKEAEDYTLGEKHTA